MVSSSWSDINSYFPCLRQVVTFLFWAILCKFYLSINDLVIMWYKMLIYFSLCMYVLRWKTFIYVHIYLVPVQDTIMFQWIFTFQAIPSRCKYFMGKWSNHLICEADPLCLCFLWYNITQLFNISLCPTLNPHTLEYWFILKITLF